MFLFIVKEYKGKVVFMVYGRVYVFSIVIFIQEIELIKLVFLQGFLIDLLFRKLSFRGVVFEFLERCWQGVFRVWECINSYIDLGQGGGGGYDIGQIEKSF